MDIEEAKDLLSKLTKDNISLTFQDEIEAIETVLNELEKKEAVINEMAKQLTELDIDELICKDIEHCTGDYVYKTCRECIKEYFTKKVEGE